ncbi:MAG: GDP-mannose 4,6-dehydratase [archaeon]
MKNVLITGITGFVGSHLSEYLLAKGYKVSGLIRWRSPMDNIEHIKDKLDLHFGDLTDAHAMQSLIDKTQPDYIFHLAAQSYVPMSWTAPTDTMVTNVVGTLQLFEAVRKSSCNPVIQVSCSSEEYGMVYPEETPIKETNPLRPLSTYAVSKVACDKLCYQYSKSYNLKTIATRSFNHTGPRRGHVFVCSNFAKQIAMIEKGKQDPVILVGSLEAKRDFTDVRDVVRAYLLIVERGTPGEVYNICSGPASTFSMQQVLDKLLAMSTVQVEVKIDPARVRPSDVPLLSGDCSKMKELTGWEPRYTFDQTLRDILEYWRKRV